MKKTFLIILGVMCVLLIIGVAVYMVLFGKPENIAEIFTQFTTHTENNDPSTDIPIEQSNNNDATTQTQNGQARLQQLTTRPVAGAYIGSSTVMFVEQGTGYVYSIDAESKKETLVSGTTIPQTTDAQFSPNGSLFAITSLTQKGTETVVGTVQTQEQTDNTTRGIVLPENVTEVTFKDETNVYYLIKKTQSSHGFIFNTQKETSTEIFSLPLRDIHIIWGTPHYVYTTPSGTQVGYVYKIEGKNTLSFVTDGVVGLLAVPYGSGIITTSITKNSQLSTAITKTGTHTEQALPFIPEKCIADPSRVTHVFCTVPNTFGSDLFPDSWYMGVVGYTDIVWDMDIETGKALFMLDLKKESGQEIDVRTLYTNPTGTKLLLINKNDNTLWLYDTTL
jgi:hypothetical protein